MFKIQNKSFRKNGTAVAAVLLIMAAGAASAQADNHVYAFKIPAENTAKALNDFARQANLQIMFPYDVAAKHLAPAISGQFTRAEVLAQLLNGTGLEVAVQSETSVTLRVATASAAKPSADIDTNSTEVVVTGTHIRHANPTSPVRSLGRNDIDASGYSQIGDFMRSQPEAFAGGQNPGVYGAGAGTGNNNLSNASTINLRGLGTGATLTLLNGHRLAADAVYQGADISGIPLAAVQRIEIVPDGASALYGSDAVAGVANIVLRRNFNGGEFSARLGEASQGGGGERTFSLLQGVSVGKAFGILNFEYSKQDAITEGDRTFVSTTTPDVTLFQPQTRKSLFLSAGYDVSDDFKLTFDGLISDRISTQVAQPSPAFQYFYSFATPAYSGAFKLDAKLASDWKLKVTAGMSGSRNSMWTNIPAFSYSNNIRLKNAVQYAEAVADGTLLTLPSGAVRLAIGGGVRREGYQQNYQDTAGGLRVDRTVQYAFAESIVPLVLPSSDRVGLNELELSLAGRTEHYSDFGSASNPKVGLRYVPFNGLTVRGTWGKSFKAPSFYELYESTEIAVFPGAYFGIAAPAQVLLSDGGNADLKPETSTSSTFGIDYKPFKTGDLVVSLTRFNIAYKNRVVKPVPVYRTALATNLYDGFVTRNPSATTQGALINAADVFEDFTGVYNPANVIAVIHNENTNATTQDVSGFDASIRQSFKLRHSTLSYFATGTWMELNQQTIPTMADLKLSGTVFFVPKFKARGGLTWTRGGLSGSAIANFVSDEKDTSVTPSRSVASWTTVDATLSYNFSQTNSVLHDLKISVAASNLFDKKPPRVAAPTTLGYPGIFYDSTNSSIVGRFVSVTLTKGW